MWMVTNGYTWYVPDLSADPAVAMSVFRERWQKWGSWANPGWEMAVFKQLRSELDRRGLRVIKQSVPIFMAKPSPAEIIALDVP